MRLTAKKLKAILEGVDDNTVILLPNNDHEYRVAEAEVTTCLMQDQWTINEDHGEELTPESVYGMRQACVVFT